MKKLKYSFSNIQLKSRHQLQLQQLARFPSSDSASTVSFSPKSKISSLTLAVPCIICLGKASPFVTP